MLLNSSVVYYGGVRDVTFYTRGGPMNNHLVFSPVERGLALVAGLFNLIVGLAFFLLPEIHSLTFIWPVSISPVLDRFIGAIILGNSVGAIWLSTEREWARV